MGRSSTAGGFAQSSITHGIFTKEKGQDSLPVSRHLALVQRSGDDTASEDKLEPELNLALPS